MYQESNKLYKSVCDTFFFSLLSRPNQLRPMLPNLLNPQNLEEVAVAAAAAAAISLSTAVEMAADTPLGYIKYLL